MSLAVVTSTRELHSCARRDEEVGLFGVANADGWERMGDSRTHQSILYQVELSRTM